MNMLGHTSDDVNTLGGGNIPPCIGSDSNVLPEVQKPSIGENSDTGVSTKYVLSVAQVSPQTKNLEAERRWYALRTTYGREKKAYEYIISNNGTAYYPTINVVKMVNGKRKNVEVSRIPNMFFAYGTKEEIESFVYDNVNLPYLRFYYKRFYDGSKIAKTPLIVPDEQINGLRIICESEAKDIIITPENVHKFKTGQMVRIVNGKFTGVVGRVARYQGQQRVAVVIDGLLTVATAYIPSAFLEKLQ